MGNKRGTEKVWNVKGNKYFYDYPSNEQPKLDVAVYVLTLTAVGFCLAKQKDSFELPSKIYGGDSSFAHRVVKTWNSKNGNLGVLLNGVKGAGKTVTAKMLCNLVNLPVVLITQSFKEQGGFNDYLSSIKETFAVFIDEYEKIFEKGDELLALMDGALSGDHRRLFICTTNELRISSYMTDRPNRIRYLRSYLQVSKEVVEEMVDDLLVHKHHRDALIKFITTLETITIDIVGNLIDEVNIHDEAPEIFKDYFNVTLAPPMYEVLLHAKVGTETTMLVPYHMGFIEWDQDYFGDNMEIGGRHIGTYQGRTENGEIMVKLAHISYIKQFDPLVGYNEGDIILITFHDKGHQIHDNFRTHFAF